VSRHVPYAPMRQAPLASDAEVKAMLARLKRRIDPGSSESAPQASHDTGLAAPAPDALRTDVRVPPASDQPHEPLTGTAAPLTWEKPEKGATGVYSTCRRYSCAKVTVKGKVIYELRRLVPGDTWYIRVPGDFGSFAEVQAAAQKLEDEP